MCAAHQTLPKMVVRDGYDDEDLTDIDDEVFIRDGKSGSLKLDDEGGVKRPLMAPRRRCKKSCSFNRQKIPYRALWLPSLYGLTALTVLIILIILCIFTANIFPMPLTILRNWLSHELKEPPNDTSIVPCTSLATKLLWSRTIPRIIITSHLTSIDANGDGIEDIIFGFDADSVQNTCTGGVLVLNGKNGETLWTHCTTPQVELVDCSLDLTSDKIKDCVILSSEIGILHAISGSDGTIIWELSDESTADGVALGVENFYDAKFVADIDGDGIGDVIASHTIRSSSEILMISGATGNIIHRTKLPEDEQLFVRYLQTLVHPDGENIFVLTICGEGVASDLYVVPQVNLMYGDLKLRKLQQSTHPTVPPILVDITSDKVDDIIAVTMVDSHIVAYDGLTFEPLWNYTVPHSEIISVPVPGYYNDDDVPDFLVKHQIGPSFPAYFYTIATVIDGKTGKSLLEKPMEDSLSREMSGLSVTVDDFGNDWFLHWSADCRNFEGEKYQFLESENFAYQAGVDLCKLRFNSTLVANLFALSQHVGPPGLSLYSSEDYRAIEYNNSADLNKDSPGIAPFVSARSANTQTSRVDENSFKSEGEDVPDIPVNPDAYNSDSSYDKFGEYKDQKRLSLSNFEGENCPPVGDNLNADYAWKCGENRKWPSEKIEPDKDYEVAYDSENNAEPVDDRNVDYPGAEELGEERRDTSDRVKRISRISDNAISSASSTNLPNSVNRANNYIRRKRESNFTVEMTNDTSSTVDNSYPSDNFNSTIEKLENTTLISMLEGLFEMKDIDNTSTSTLEPEYNTTVDSSTDNNTATSNSDELDSIIKSAEKYVHIYPSPIEDTDDESIEKIFKRESLKNQNNRVNRGKQLKYERHKRQVENESRKKSKADGLRREPKTGILLPSYMESKGRISQDLVFTTSWFLGPDISVMLLPEDLECMHRKKALLARKVQYRLSGQLAKDCFKERGVNPKHYEQLTSWQIPKVYHGQMTVYRMKLECVCPEDMLPNQSCKNISSQQTWPQYLGVHGSGHFRPLRMPKV